MILTITLNPLLDKTIFLNSIELDKVNRAYRQTVIAGGKGINVSRQLNNFNIENLATGFLGGESGKKIRSLLARENIKNSFIHTKSETREGLVAVTNNSITSFFDPDPVISASEIEEFISKTKKSISNTEMVIFSGSIPKSDSETNKLFGMDELITFANENDKITILDVYSRDINVILESKPLVVHFNKSEVKYSFGIEPDSEKDIISFLNWIYGKGIKICFITDGELPLYAINQKFIYKCTPLPVKTLNSTGSGDAFMAGFISAFHQNLPFEDSLRYASAAGSLNASRLEICNISKSEVEEVYGQVLVTKLN